MIEEMLQELGFSRRESLCYLTLLELGPSKVGGIVKRSGIPSSKVYEVLESLKGKGFVTSVVKSNVRHYRAADPKSLLHLAEERKKRVEEAIPDLLRRQKGTARQGVEMYEGQKAVFTLFVDLIAEARPGEPYLVFSIDEENKTEQADVFFKNLALRRKQKRIDVLLLKNDRFYVKERHTKVRMRYSPFNLPQGVTVFRDCVVLLSWNESPVAIRIESAEFARQWREFFQELWKGART